MIYEIAEIAKKEVEKNCDAYEIYVDESKSIELDSRKDELNFAKEIAYNLSRTSKIEFLYIL